MSKVIKIKRGLDIPMLGEAEKVLQPPLKSVEYAIRPPVFHGLVPKMLVEEGTAVKAGTPLFFDKYNEDILYTSPVSGTYKQLVRGAKRRIMEVRIEADGKDEHLDFGVEPLSSLTREQIIRKLLKSGLWPAVRKRPYAIVANPKEQPRDIFISAFKSAPLAPDMDFIVSGREAQFQAGLDVLGRLTKGDVHVSIDAAGTMSKAFRDARGVKVHAFSGPHPAGNIGIQIHHIKPLNKGEVVWYVDVQDVIAIGILFEKGIYDAHKIVALTGSEVLNPRYYKIINGAKLSAFAENNIRAQKDVTPRFISGDALTGERINLDGFIGYYDDQVTVIPEGKDPELLGWLIATPEKYSVSRTFLSFLMPWKKFKINTNIRSGERPFVITGLYEKYLPMDVMPMQLVKSVMINDIDMMEKLGIYEVAPEDFALCEFVCPSKIEMQSIIRNGLDVMIKEFA